jgi:hypothetical protein
MEWWQPTALPSAIFHIFRRCGRENQVAVAAGSPDVMMQGHDQRDREAARLAVDHSKHDEVQDLRAEVKSLKFDRSNLKQQLDGAAACNRLCFPDDTGLTAATRAEALRAQENTIRDSNKLREALLDLLPHGHTLSLRTLSAAHLASA